MNPIIFFALLSWLVSGLAWGASPSTRDYFAVSELPTPPGTAAPSLLWQDAQGVNARVNGTFYRLENKRSEWTEVPADNVFPESPMITARAGGKLFVFRGQEVITLEFVNNAIEEISFSKLPVAVVEGAAEFLGGTLHVMGRDADGKNVFLGGSEILVPWSETPARRILAAQSQGLLYVFSQEDDAGHLTAFEYNPRKRAWRSLAVSEFPIPADAAFASGDAHVLFPAAGAERVGAFYITQKRWIEFDADFLTVAEFSVLGDSTSFLLASPGGYSRVSVVFPPTKYGYLDHLVVAAFFVLMLWMGMHFSKQEKTQNDFFRGGQRFPAWAIGMSMFATGASAISLMAMPAMAYAQNWIYFSVGILQVLMLPLVFFIVIPITRRLQFSSAFEYLEARYSHPVRLVGSIGFCSIQILGRLASIMLLPAIALSAICGIPMDLSILIMGGVTTIYCMMGGFEAVVWTDVIQGFVILATVTLCIVWVFVELNVPGAEIWQLIQVENKLQIADFSWDVTQPIFAMLLISGLLGAFVGLGDQNFIQRVQAVPTEKEARTAVVTQLGVAVPLNALLFGLGTCLFVYYHFNAAELSPAMKADAVFPLFAAQKLPAGLAGLVVAALMAATMSTLSSALNSVSNVVLIDYVRPLRKTMSEHEAVLWGRGLTVALGVIGTLLALWLARSNATFIFDMILQIVGVVFSPLNALFLLGVLTTRVHTGGIVTGVLAGYAATIYANNHLTVHPFFFGLIGLLPTIIVAYLFCLIFPRRTPRDLTGLTIFSLPPMPTEKH